MCQVKIATGDLDAALTASTNLLQALRYDRSGDSAVNRAESVALQAGILEKMGRTQGEALAVFQQKPHQQRSGGKAAAGRLPRK